MAGADEQRSEVCFKNRTGGKIGFASGYRFSQVLTRVLGSGSEIRRGIKNAVLENNIIARRDGGISLLRDRGI